MTRDLTLLSTYNDDFLSTYNDDSGTSPDSENSLFHLNPTINTWEGLVLDAKTEVQRGLVICLRTHASKWGNPEFSRNYGWVSLVSRLSPAT